MEREPMSPAELHRLMLAASSLPDAAEERRTTVALQILRDLVTADAMDGPEWIPLRFDEPGGPPA